METLREDLFRREEHLNCIGKLVPNIIRDQDNLFVELVLPDLDIEGNVEEAVKMLAPFLIISNHMIFNL